MAPVQGVKKDGQRLNKRKAKTLIAKLQKNGGPQSENQIRLLQEAIAANRKMTSKELEEEGIYDPMELDSDDDDQGTETDGKPVDDTGQETTTDSRPEVSTGQEAVNDGRPAANTGQETTTDGRPEVSTGQEAVNDGRPAANTGQETVTDGRPGDDNANGTNKGKERDGSTSQNTKLPTKENKSADRPLPSIERNDNNTFSPDSEGDPEEQYVDPELGLALYTTPGSQDRKDFESVAYSASFDKDSEGKPHTYINKYGKSSSVRFRLDKFTTPEYKQNKPQSDNTSRRRVGRDKKYDCSNLKAVLGIAFVGSLDPSAVEILNPAKKPNWRKVRTEICVVWEEGGLVEKSWETRSQIRKLYRDADQKIYEWALDAECRCEEVRTGKRIPRGDSPPFELGAVFVRDQRDKAIAAKGIRSSPFPQAGSARSSLSPQPDDDVWKQRRERFLKDYLEMMGVESFKDLPPEERMLCLSAWAKVQQ